MAAPPDDRFKLLFCGRTMADAYHFTRAKLDDTKYNVRSPGFVRFPAAPSVGLSRLSLPLYGEPRYTASASEFSERNSSLSPLRGCALGGTVLVKWTRISHRRIVAGNPEPVASLPHRLCGASAPTFPRRWSMQTCWYARALSRPAFTRLRRRSAC